MHLIVAREGSLRVTLPTTTDATTSRTRGAPRGARAETRVARGVLTSPDVAHAVDGSGAEVLLVFLEPESEAGVALRATFASRPGPARSKELRVLTDREASRILQAGGPDRIMGPESAEWTREIVAILGGDVRPAPRVHPRVRALLRLLRERDPSAPVSLEALASEIDLSPSRLMHVFTETIGIPLRPYLAWLKLQRAAAAIVSGLPLTQAAYAAGYADAAHMSRSFRRMLGMTPSSIKPRATSAR